MFRRVQIIALSLAAMAFGTPAAAQEAAFADLGPTGSRADLTAWRYSPGDGGGREAPGFDDSTWAETELPAKLILKDGTGWLRGEFGVDADPRPLYVLIGRIDAAAEVYLNGSLIGRRGTFEPDFSTPTNLPGAFLIPEGLLDPGGGNVLAVKLQAPASALTISGVQLGDAAADAFDRKVQSFLNFELYGVLGALCAFIGVYFIALWLGRKSETTNLWYAVSSFAIAFYFVEIGSTFPIFEYTLNRALAKACLTVSMAALVAFFRSFFGIRRSRIFDAVLVIVPLASIVAYVAARADYVRVDAIFNLNLVFVQAAIVFIVFVTVRGALRGNKEAIPMLVGVALGVGFGTHDVVFSAMGRKPVAWLQGIGFFCMNLSLFVTLTLRSSRLYAELERYSRDVDEKTRQLADYLSRIESTADSVSAITTEIDSDAVRAAAAADKLASEADRIGASAERQASASRESGQAVERLAESLGLVRSGVDAQAAGIRDSAESVAVVADAAASVSASVASTAEFAKGLGGTAEKGREASRSVGDAIAKIQDAAAKVVSIVDAVEEFAERTNLLSMNAAIEAAHAGNAGRGFSVIASEIKGLAGASAERVARIRDSINDIGKRIDHGVRANSALAATLDSVADGARIALDGILSVSRSLETQRTATDRLRTALRELAESASSIRAEAERQDEEGKRIGSSMAELVGISDGMRRSLAGIALENAEIAETMKRLASVSKDGKEAVAGLRRLLESRKGA